MIERSCGQVYKHAYVCACARWFFLFFLSFLPPLSFVRFIQLIQFIHTHVHTYTFYPTCFPHKNFFFRTLDHHKPFFFSSLLISITHTYTPNNSSSRKQPFWIHASQSYPELPTPQGFFRLFRLSPTSLFSCLPVFVLPLSPPATPQKKNTCKLLTWALASYLATDPL